MLHVHRTHDVVDVTSLEELAELLTGGAWSLTTGFRIGEATFLNDSTRPDAIQEYAVFVRGEQAESITIDGLTAASALSVLRAIIQRTAEASIAGQVAAGQS